MMTSGLFDAIILAGGFGKRIAKAVPDLPKPLAPINGKPILSYILDKLDKWKISKVILAVGYRANDIQKYYGEKYLNIDICYSLEEKPLGTGGAIKKAFSILYSKNAFVLNGDTLFDIDFYLMQKEHLASNADITVAVKKSISSNRFGTLNIENKRIKNFIEKNSLNVGPINGGIYCIGRDYFLRCEEEAFSFEKDILEKKAQNDRFFAFESEGYFIDIGIPEDYERAQKEL